MESVMLGGFIEDVDLLAGEIRLFFGTFSGGVATRFLRPMIGYLSSGARPGRVTPQVHLPRGQE